MWPQRTVPSYWTCRGNSLTAWNVSPAIGFILRKSNRPVRKMRRNQSLQWHHNGRYGVLNHQPHDCLLYCLFRRRSKKTSKLRATGLCAGNSPVTGEFTAQMASNTENVSIWWRHHRVTHRLFLWAFRYLRDMLAQWTQFEIKITFYIKTSVQLTYYLTTICIIFHTLLSIIKSREKKSYWVAK